jgi:hypothetical protein
VGFYCATPDVEDEMAVVGAEEGVFDAMDVRPGWSDGGDLRIVMDYDEED